MAGHGKSCRCLRQALEYEREKVSVHGRFLPIGKGAAMRHSRRFSTCLWWLGRMVTTKDEKKLGSHRALLLIAKRAEQVGTG